MPEQHPFVEFLIERDLIPPNISKQLADKRRILREPIGMIAAGHGLLKTAQIDSILDEQRTCEARFGDIAVRLNCIEPEQIETLLKIQQFRAAVDIAEALALSGTLKFDDVVWYLGSFLMGDREVMAMISEEGGH